MSSQSLVSFTPLPIPLPEVFLQAHPTHSDETLPTLSPLKKRTKTAATLLTDSAQLQRVPKKRYARKVVTKLTETPGVFIATPEKGYTDTDFKSHAYLRVMLFALESVALSGLGLRSNSTKRKLNLSIDSAYLQIGKGSKTDHAAHPNANAGRTDNLRESLFEGIIKSFEEMEINPIINGIEKNKITPRTERILKCKGFTQEDLEKMRRNINPEKVAKIFNEIWPVNKKSPPSILSGTSLEQVLNSTTQLPRLLNLACDKGLEEAIRPRSLELYEKVFYEQISLEEACVQYCQAITDYFTRVIPYIEKRIVKIANYKKIFETDITDLNKEDTKKHLINLSETITEINTFKKPATDENKNKRKFYRYILKANKKFLNGFIYNLNQNDSSFDLVKTAFANVFERLINEIDSEIDRLKQRREYCYLEKEGTQVPDFNLLFGTMNSQGQRVLKKEDLSSLQERLLSKT